VGARLRALAPVPAAQVFGPLTSVVVARTLLLNALGGVAFGALYWRSGLEHAMVARFCTDIVLHVVAGDDRARSWRVPAVGAPRRMPTRARCGNRILTQMRVKDRACAGESMHEP
jgi:hypothetical protein